MPTATERINALNPFSKKEAHSVRSITTYKVLTILSWLLSLVVTLYYTFNEPRDGFTIRRRIWDQNYLYPTAFTLNSVIVDIYWIVLFILQVGYVAHLFSSNSDYVNAAASVGSHFIFNNLLHFAFVMLFVRSHFVWAELILLINFANLSSLYFRHNTYPRFIHWPVISAPLAWTFVAIYWNGAIMVPHPHSLVARIFGNIFIWSILVYGGFFIVAYKDYTIGFSLSALAAAIGVAQFHRQVIAFQWIFAFTIMAVLFVSTLVTAYPAATGKDYPWRSRSSAPADAERAPLLADDQFAAKEAAFKAHPFRKLSFHDITIVRRALEAGREKNANGSGPPVAVIRGEREGEPEQTAAVSISHDGDYATAVCLGFEPEATDGVD
ncbi:ATP synthase F0 [Colletotrichum tabaci]